MAERYSLGVRRLFHRAKGFQESLSVTMDILNPLMGWEKDIILVETGGGLYYTDYNFQLKGTYVSVVYENGVKVTSQNFHISEDDPGPTSSFGSVFRGPSVINT